MENKQNKLTNLSFYIIYAIFAVIVPFIIAMSVGLWYGIISFIVLNAVVITLFGEKDNFHKSNEETD